MATTKSLKAWVEFPGEELPNGKWVPDERMPEGDGFEEWQRGRKAFRLGLSENPYSTIIHPAEHSLWQNGWEYEQKRNN